MFYIGKLCIVCFSPFFYICIDLKLSAIKYHSDDLLTLIEIYIKAKISNIL